MKDEPNDQYIGIKQEIYLSDREKNVLFRTCWNDPDLSVETRILNWLKTHSDGKSKQIALDVGSSWKYTSRVLQRLLREEKVALDSSVCRWRIR